MERHIAKRNSMFTIALFLAIVQIIEPGSEQAKGRKDISRYLPKSGELKEWEPVGSPQKFVGEDLYLLINGGAVIYYEYGFEQVITQEYINKDGKSINLEIYEMINPASAYGIYSFKISGNGDEIAVGTDALLEDYYLNFWKGNFLVTLIAAASEETTLNGLLAIASAVDKRIEEKRQRPSLCDLLSMEGLKISNIKYIKGNLALSSNYNFATEDIFGLKEGVIGDYGDFSVYIFKYSSPNLSVRWYKNARDYLKTSGEFNNFVDFGEECIMMDVHGNTVYISPYENYILIYLGSGGADPRTIIKKFEQEIH